MTALPISLLLLAQAAATPAALQPAGPWRMEYAQSSCILSRIFAGPEEPLILALEPGIYGGGFSVTVLQSPKTRRAHFGPASIEAGSLVHKGSSFFAERRGDHWVTTFGFPADFADELAKGAALRVRAGTNVDASFLLTGFGKALTALRACEADLLAGWGFDKAAQAAVAVKPEGKTQRLLTPGDYPVAALQRGARGTVTYRMRVSETGKVSDCAVVRSSGHDDLDQTTCRILLQRARFKPALGHDGKPMSSFTFGTIVWTVFDD